jgi:serine/threonine protein kinase
VSEQYRPLSRGLVIADRYEIEKYLGESLLGPTYVVKNINTNKLLALKFIRSDYKESDELRDVQELLKRARRVQHDHVVRYGNVGTYQEEIFFTQEYFPSVNLRQLILDYEAEEKLFAIKEACQIASKVLEALSAIHEQGIYHTNIKPENILIRHRRDDKTGRMVREIKITDIMAASILGDGSIAPSPYRAPECRPEYGMMSRGPQADVYSVGNILYELLIGKPATGTYLSPSQLRDDLGSAIDSIIDIALSPTPTDRYDDPRSMLKSIQLSFSEVFRDEGGPKLDHRLILAVTGFLIVVVLAVFSYVLLLAPAELELSDLEKDTDLRQVVSVKAEKLWPSEEKWKILSDKHPEMVYIPAGPSLLGPLNQEFSFGLARPGQPVATEVEVDAFYIDRFEFPNVKEDKDGNPIPPITGQNHDQATELCEKLGKRLCSSYEWEKSCKGPGNKIYSYGDSYDPDLCKDSDDYLLGANETCSSGYGVFGLSGGPREWTSTPSPGSSSRRLIKGGEMVNVERGFRCSFQTDDLMGYADDQTSFRCCLDAE